MANAVFGIAVSEFQAEAIVNELKVAGFSDPDISVLLADKARQNAPGVKTTGGTLGWLAGIQAIAIPGLGPYIASGPIRDALGGSAVGGSPRAIAAALAGMGLGAAEARHCEQKIRNGHLLIAVHSDSDDHTCHAQAIFAQAEAQDITISSDAEAPPPEVEDEKWRQ